MNVNSSDHIWTYNSVLLFTPAHGNPPLLSRCLHDLIKSSVRFEGKDHDENATCPSGLMSLYMLLSSDLKIKLTHSSEI